MAVFERTRKAALKDKVSKWDLIAAIAEDAVEAGIPITSFDSRTAAHRAMRLAGHEHADRTIESMTRTAEFDYESTPAQRELWRRYGWSLIQEFVNNRWTQEAAFEALKSGTVTFREARALFRSAPSATALSLPELWAKYMVSQDKAFHVGAEAAERSEGVELDPMSAAAQAIYTQLIERRIDAEFRELLDRERA